MEPQQPQYGAYNNSRAPAHGPPIYRLEPYGTPAMKAGPPVTDQKRHHSPHPQAMPPQTQAAPPVYQASPNPPPGGRRILHIYHQGWTHRHTQVMDSDKVTPVYTINSNIGGLFSSKPHMTILNAATGTLAGTVTFRPFATNIDIEIHGRPITLTRPSIFTTAHQFRSLATGCVFTWRRDGIFSGGNLRCTDETEQTVANFESSNWALQKDGKIEIAPVVSGLFFDEVLITGIAAIEFQRRQQG